MANMSYCRFQNTYGDFLDCIDALEDFKLNSDNEEEKRAAEKMYYMCQRYMDAYEEWKDNEDAYKDEE